MSKVILCIVEGERTEPVVVGEVARHFIDSSRTKIVPFKAEIYQLYETLSNSEDDDDYTESLFAHLQKKNPDDEELNSYTRSDIAEIYLFFDYDGHATRASDQKIQEMLLFFNDETDNGKLYISYPMVEACKDNPLNFKTSPISLGRGYKALVNDRCDNNLKHPIKMTLDEWVGQFLIHLKAGNLLVSDDINLPDYDIFVNDLTQDNIFRTQLLKHILPNKSVFILGAFVYFILDYRGVKLLDEWVSAY